ncbi:hypothetical protein PT2222_90021 [Paraburkholderia tropica]
MPRDEFGHAGRTLAAFALDRHVPHDLRAAAFDLAHFLHAEAPAHARIHRHRRREAHAVHPIVHAHALTQRNRRLQQHRHERQREKAMCDRTAERRLAARALGVEVNPLMIAGGVGETLHARRAHGAPAAHERLGAHACAQGVEIGDFDNGCFAHFASPE